MIGPGTDFEAVRAEFGLPPTGESDTFPADVLLEARRAASAMPPPEDATALPLVTIDPPGSPDLDQAVFIERCRGGFRVHYAIADLGAVIVPGGALDTEVRRRGQTLYLPDRRVPLHPAVLSEGAASLLPGEERRAALWTIEVGVDGLPTDVVVRRARVRSRARLDYAGVQADIEAGQPHPSLEPLPELGRLRRDLALQRGAIELQLPEQEITADGGGWRVRLRLRTEVEAWNAEISLLTGMCAAQLMMQAGIGVLRTLPAPDEGVVAGLRRSATALGLDWPGDVSAATVLAAVDTADPRGLALMTDATRLLRGAGYTAFDGTTAEQTFHGGIGAPYAHVTAPLRRLVDRYGTEVCLAVAGGQPVPEWVRAALPELPAAMAASDALAGKIERTCLEQVEAWTLADRVGQRFPAVVLHAGEDGGEVFLPEPPVIARCTGAGLADGSRVTVRLVEADPATRTVAFATS